MTSNEIQKELWRIDSWDDLARLASSAGCDPELTTEIRAAQGVTSADFLETSFRAWSAEMWSGFESSIQDLAQEDS